MGEKEKEIAKVRAERTVQHDQTVEKASAPKAAQRQQEDWIIVGIM